MEILFVTGKGGVGKSAVAAALALQKAQSGLKTALVELGEQSFYQDYLGLKNVGYKPTRWNVAGQTGVDVGLWSSQEALREYAIHLLKIESLYQLFFQNPVSRALINVAPALNELAILGKITSGPPRNVGPRMPYDCLVVDAYASGHFMSLLRAPVGLAQAIRFGPMAEQSKSMIKVIKDPKICSYYIVCLPEELPIVEGLELAGSIEKEIGAQPTFVLNKLLPEDVHASAGPQDSERVAAFLKQLKHQQAQQKQMATRLQDSKQLSKHKVIPLPMVLSNNAEQICKTLEQALPKVVPHA